MASGHVNRTNRPNTWLHRLATRREDSPCQLGAVNTWHFSAVPTAQSNVGYLGWTGRHMLNASSSHFETHCGPQQDWRVRRTATSSTNVNRSLLIHRKIVIK